MTKLDKVAISQNDNMEVANFTGLCAFCNSAKTTCRKLS